MRSGTWTPWRRAVAVLAVAVASLTGAAATSLAGAGSGAWMVYTGTTVLAVLSPGLIVAQVVAGQLLVAGALLGPTELEVLAILPLAAGLVASAELLGVAARLDLPVARHPGGDLRRVAVATLVGAAAFGIVLWVADRPAPGGPVAVALASGALVTLAVLLTWRARA